MTLLTCRCGGALQTDYAGAQRAISEAMIRIAGPLLRHRKRRILKKWLKRWEAKARLALLVPPLARPNFVCEKCKKRDGFYSAIGRNLFPVEPMPPGALPVYDRDLGVSELVTEPPTE